MRPELLYLLGVAEVAEEYRGDLDAPSSPFTTLSAARSISVRSARESATFCLVRLGL